MRCKSEKGVGVIDWRRIFQIRRIYGDPFVLKLSWGGGRRQGSRRLSGVAVLYSRQLDSKYHSRKVTKVVIKRNQAEFIQY